MESMHLVADLECLHSLDDIDAIVRFMHHAIAKTDLSIEHMGVRAFQNGSDFGPGITGLALLSTSHMAVHTAPERTTLNRDLYSCKPFPVDVIKNLVDAEFGIWRINRWDVLSR